MKPTRAPQGAVLAFLIAQGRAQNPDWESLGGDYFIASWEKKRFEEKKAASKTPADTVGT